MVSKAKKQYRFKVYDCDTTEFYFADSWLDGKDSCDKSAIEAAWDGLCSCGDKCICMGKIIVSVEQIKEGSDVLA